jgi:predicted Zn-dependent peptidase
MQKTILDNGLTILSKKDANAISATISFFVKAGSYQEKNYPNGIAHFIEHMMFKGTNKRSSFDINDEIESVGGMMNAYTSYDVTKYYTKIPYDQWKVGLDILLDMLWNAQFPEEELQKERNVVLDEINMKNDNPSQQAFDILNQTLHKNYEERKSIIGTPESVSKVTRNDMIRFVDEFYQPNNVVFVATGNVEHEQIVDYIKNFKSTRNGVSNIKIDPFTFEGLTNETITIEKEINQANIAFAMNGPTVYDEDLPTLQIISRIMGGGMSSRLFKTIREERGLAYTVSMGISPNRDSGFIKGYVGTYKDKMEEVKTIIKEELNRLRYEEVTDKELNKAINYSKGTFMMGLEGNASQNEYIGRNFLLGLSADPNEDIEKIEKVTKEDIKRVANKYFEEDNYLFVQVVPK